MRRRGLLYVALVLFISPPTHALNCTVLTQNSGERITGSVCRLLEKDFLSEGHGEAAADDRGEGVVMELEWLLPTERRDLPMLLAYLSAMEIRAAMELPATRYNDGPMSLLAAHGGAVFEREATERIGATRSLTEAFVTSGGAFLVIDDFIPHESNEVTRAFEVPVGTEKILVTALITDPTGAIRLSLPGGAALAPSRRTAKALQWEIPTPAGGTWRLAASRTLRTRLYVQIPGVADPMKTPSCVAPGEIAHGIPPEGTWRIDRATEDGLRLVAQGGENDRPRTPSEGTFALTWRTGGRFYRRGVHAGAPRPILFRPTPAGIVRTVPDTGIRCAVLGMGLEGFTARVGGAPASVEAVPCGSAYGVSAAELRIPAPTETSEGPLRVEVSAAGSTDSWIYTLDIPKPREIRISEVHPGGGWLELEALQEIENLSVFGLTDLEGDPVSLPEGRLAAGERITIQFQRARNGGVMVGAPLSKEIGVTGREEIAVVRGTGEEKAFLDVVVLDDGTETKWSEAELRDLELLASRGEWSGEAVRWPGLHASLGRLGDGDANASTDWHPLYYPSSGEANTADPRLETLAPGDVAITEVSLWDDRNRWIEIEVRNGPVDISALSFTDLDGDEARLGTDPQILPSGTRSVIRFGNANTGEIRLNPAASPSQGADQAVLMLGEKIIDAVAWRTPGEATPREEVDDATWLGITPIDRPGVVPGVEHPSMARFGGWEWTYAPTPGAANARPAEPARGSVRIAAVSPSEFEGDWAEIVCLSGPVDVSRFILTDLDGRDTHLAELPVTLQTGEKVVVHWSQGRDEVDGAGDLNGNGVRDLYLVVRDALSSSDDQLALVWGGKIYDAVIFTNGDGTMSRDEQKDFAYLLAAGHWSGSVSQNDAVNVGTYRLPVERIDPTQDTNGKGDWRSRTPPANQ